ncbi:MAG: ribosome maturation factor RimM [Clostridia bacterium]|nr:ribosome maturation factor RimM [Clostridia bacterium]
MQENKLTVAAVLKPQGIRGEVKVKALTDSAEDLKDIKVMEIGGVEYAVLSVRAQGEFAYLTLRGVADRNAAELLRGLEVCVSRDNAPPLPEGRYYIADLIGCEVFTSRGERLGGVVDVTPAKTDVYTLSNGVKQIVFAAADGVITDVDIEARKIVVDGKRFKEVSL